jgi:hypothetical protein
MSANKTKVLLIIGALVLFVLLFIAPKIAKQSDVEETGDAASSAANLEVYVNLAMKNLEPVKKRALEDHIKLNRFDSVIVFWSKLKRPDLAAYFSEKESMKTNTSASWYQTGNRYYYAVQFTQDKSEVPALYQSATRSFKKSLALNPKNTDAKIMLASCFVEGSANPMEGINLLREVEKIDSNNVKLQLAFAFFSVKSGQPDRAISRFNKVLKIDSNYIEAYLHLADLYEQQGNTEKTIESLEKYAGKTEDVTERLELNKYIQQLKSQK